MINSELISKAVSQLAIELDLLEDEVDFTFSNPHAIKVFIESIKLKCKEQIETNQIAKQSIEEIESILEQHEEKTQNVTSEELALIYEKLKNRELNPSGKFDKQGRFYLEDKELVDVKEPSVKHPYSQMTAGRTAKFVKAIAAKYKVQNLEELESLFNKANKKFW